MFPLLSDVLAVAGGGKQSVDLPEQEQLMDKPSEGLLQLLGLEDFVRAEWLLRLLAAVIALLVVVVIYRVVVTVINRAARGNGLVESVRPQLLIGWRWLIVPIGLLFVLQQSGFDVGSVLTMITGILAMVALGFVAVWSVASNVLAAFLIFSTKLFRIGDYIQFTNVDGGLGMTAKIRDMRLLFTELEEVRGGEHAGHGGVIRMPNNFFFQNPIRVFPALSDELKAFLREDEDDQEEDQSQSRTDGGGAAAAAASQTADEPQDAADDGNKH
jgi:small-conductance mechanosensitive channel